jgi:small subunit ribosomal protein S6
MVRRQRSVRTRKTPMPLYEHVFLARQDLSQAQVDALAESATKIVEENQGKVVKTETWGLRSLAYKIQKNRKAHFVMLERQTRMNEDVIRYMTIRVDEHEKGPSVMMRKNERSDRGERGGFGDRPERAPRGDRAERAPRAQEEI